MVFRGKPASVAGLRQCAAAVRVGTAGMGLYERGSRGFAGCLVPCPLAPVLPTLLQLAHVDWPSWLHVPHCCVNPP